MCLIPYSNIDLLYVLLEEVVTQRLEVPEPKVQDVRIINDNVGLLAIKEFNERTLLEVQNAIDVLKGRAGDLEALVLDLRENGGGLISAAFEVASMFLPKGKILSRIQSSDYGPPTIVRSINRRADTSTSLLVVVDGKTASASEILAAALVDNNRAVCMGTKTVGKNMAQAIVRLSDGCGLVFTVRSFSSPLQR